MKPAAGRAHDGLASLRIRDFIRNHALLIHLFIHSVACTEREIKGMISGNVLLREVGMKKILVGLACAATCLTAFAGDWYIAYQGDDIANFLDLSSKEKKGSILSLWSVAVLKDTSKEISYVLIRGEYDCSRNRYRSVDATAYSLDGNPMASLSNDKWERAIPGSVGKTILDHACGKPPKMTLKMSPKDLARAVRGSFFASGTWR